MDARIKDIIARAQEGMPPSYDEVMTLLALDETSCEATAVRNAANDMSRAAHGNAACIWGQIGIDVYPCEADCLFCSFGCSHTYFTEHVTLPVEEVVRRAKDFARGGDMYGIYLMCMNTYDEDYFLEVVRAVRAAVPESVLLFSNIGDTDLPYFQKLKEAGLDGAYHVKRIGEGVVTAITPERREATIQAAHEAGLMMSDCCEPVGAETPHEAIAQRLMEIREHHLTKGIEAGCGVMKRTSVPGTPFEGMDKEITDLRLGLLNAIEVLLLADADVMPWISFHEPNMISLMSGGCRLCAETGFNPRDTAEDTTGHHGLDVPTVRSMLYQAGFAFLERGDGSRVALTPDYMQAKIEEAATSA